MNAMTPPKTDPTIPEHGGPAECFDRADNEMIATNGPTIGPHSFATAGCPVRKKARQKAVRYPRSKRAGQKQTDDDIEPNRDPIHHKVVACCGEAFC